MRRYYVTVEIRNLNDIIIIVADESKKVPVTFEGYDLGLMMEAAAEWIGDRDEKKMEVV